jgi:hypothetical protein
MYSDDCIIVNEFTCKFSWCGDCVIRHFEHGSQIRCEGKAKDRRTCPHWH